MKLCTGDPHFHDIMCSRKPSHKQSLLPINTILRPVLHSRLRTGNFSSYEGTQEVVMQAHNVTKRDEKSANTSEYIFVNTKSFENKIRVELFGSICHVWRYVINRSTVELCKLQMGTDEVAYCEPVTDQVPHTIIQPLGPTHGTCCEELEVTLGTCS